MPVAAATQSVNLIDDKVKIIPEKMSNYVPFGHYKDVKNIIKSKIFFPVFVTGLSGNGKTLMIEQTCAALKRELFRVNITVETDEDDLMGGHTLQNGNIIFREGPVIKAIPIPANKALIKKSSNMIIAFGLLFHLANEYDRVYVHIK